MLAARLPALVALFVMLVVAPVPWRVTAHADEHHGHVWLPDAHAWEHVLQGHRGPPTAPRRTCSCAHEPQAPQAPPERGCHCTDEPLATGVPFVVVQCDAPLAGARADVALLGLATSLGVPEVAPSEPGGCRRACIEDPVVLLR